MTSLKKSVALACAASVLGIGMAFAQTDPAAAPSTDPAMAAPAGDPAMAPAAGGDSMSAMPKKKHMSKKHMSKKHMKKSKMM